MKQPLLDTGTQAHPILLVDETEEYEYECVYTGDEVSSAAVVRLCSPLPDVYDVFDSMDEIDEERIASIDAPFADQPLKLISQQTADAGNLSIGAIDALRETIGELSEITPTESLAPSGRVRYDVMTGDIPYVCMACGETVENGTTVVAFKSTYQNTGVIHDRCTDVFTAALSDVWEYTDDMLSSNL